MEILLLKLCPKIIKAITNTGSILLVLWGIDSHLGENQPPQKPIAFEIFQKVLHNWGQWPYPGLVLKLWCIQA
jgi:hypothetical protein